MYVIVPVFRYCHKYLGPFRSHDSGAWAINRPVLCNLSNDTLVLLTYKIDEQQNTLTCDM